MKAVIYLTEIPEKYAGKNMEHLIGEKLLEKGLFCEYGKKLEFEPRAAGEHGKPFFTLQPGIHYNVTHSGKYVACIFTGQEVGIDIQEHKEVRYQQMMKRMVPAEIEEKILGEKDWKKDFFDQWTLREAYVKWTGEGFSRDLRSIPMEEGWHSLIDVEEGYSGAVWSASPLEITRVQVEAELP